MLEYILIVFCMQILFVSSLVLNVCSLVSFQILLYHELAVHTVTKESLSLRLELIMQRIQIK